MPTQAYSPCLSLSCLSLSCACRWSSSHPCHLSCGGREEEHVVGADVVVADRVVVFELFACEDETLLVGWDSFSVLDFGFDILNAVTWLNFQCDVLSCEGFDEDLHEFVAIGDDGKPDPDYDPNN
jgi:hypothetical protein